MNQAGFIQMLVAGESPRGCIECDRRQRGLCLRRQRLTTRLTPFAKRLIGELRGRASNAFHSTVLVGNHFHRSDMVLVQIAEAGALDRIAGAGLYHPEHFSADGDLSPYRTVADNFFIRAIGVVTGLGDLPRVIGCLTHTPLVGCIGEQGFQAGPGNADWLTKYVITKGQITVAGHEPLAVIAKGFDQLAVLVQAGDGMGTGIFAVYQAIYIRGI